MITVDYQGELDEAFLFGADTDIRIARDGDRSIVGAVAAPNVRTNDLAFSLADGSAGGFDSYEPRMLTIPLKTTGADTASARERLQPFLDAWQPPRTTEIPLDLRLPGQPEEVLRYFGRPRAVDETRVMWHLNQMRVDAHFDCLDPFGYGAETEAVSYGDELDIDNIGNVAEPLKSRCTLTATAAGGSPPFTIQNLDDPDGLTMTFLELPDVLHIDLHGWNLTDDDGTCQDRQLRNDSGWPVLKPGANRFVFDGFTALSAVWRPAYL